MSARFGRRSLLVAVAVAVAGTTVLSLHSSLAGDPADAPQAGPVEGPSTPRQESDELGVPPEDGEEEKHLPGPTLRAWPPGGSGKAEPAEAVQRRPETPMQGLAWYYKTDIFFGPGKKPTVMGYVRRGTRLPINRRLSGPGCPKGSWYELKGGGVVCTTAGVTVSSKAIEFTMRQRPPRLASPFQFRYGKVMKDAAPRLFRIPTPGEETQIAAAAAGQEDYPEVVDRTMEGVFVLALDRVEQQDKRRYWRTIRGRYIAAGVVERYPRSQMHGALLSPERTLPLAFVYDQDQPLYCRDEGTQEPRVCGTAEKHARFSFDGKPLTLGGKTYVQGPGGVLLRRAGVRLLRAKARPAAVGRGEKWIHVDLGNQTLVAYEGDTPVLATLVSGGKEGYEAPLGTFRIHEKHVSITMNGDDPHDGWYEVEEVPWTMYYWEGYALHGAYWHNDFGKPRSHGCTNLAPADALWLFRWTDPEVPQRWHARMSRGTRVHFTR